MTLEELNCHRLMVNDLEAAEELLAHVKASALHSSNFEEPTCSPYTIRNRTQRIVVRCAELESEIAGQQKAVKASEGRIQAFIDTIQDRRTAFIFGLRFLDGYEWPRVAEIVGGKNSTEGVKSLVYRYIREQSGTAKE